MKKIQCGIVSIALCLALAGCGSAEKAEPFVPADDARTLLDSGAFSEALTAIDRDIACALYGIDGDTVTDSAVYGSTGATAEELAIFTFQSEDAAQTAATALGYRVEDRKESLAGYLPDELPKLDKAVVERRGASALLVIAADYGPVESFLGGGA